MKEMPIIDMIYFILLFACFGTCLLKRQNLHCIRYVIVLLGIMILIQVYAEYLNLHNVNNMYLYHILTPVEYSVLAVVFAFNISRPIVKNILLYSIPVFILLAVVFGKMEGTTLNNSYAAMLEDVILITASLISLREMLLLSNAVKVNRSPFFWFTVAVLFYCVGNLPVSVMFSYLIAKDVNIVRTFYKYSYIYEWQFFILLTIASYMSEKAKQ